MPLCSRLFVESSVSAHIITLFCTEDSTKRRERDKAFTQSLLNPHSLLNPLCKCRISLSPLCVDVSYVYTYVCVLCVYVCMHIYIYIYICVLYIYMYI